MLYDTEKSIARSDLDLCLKELAKEYRRLNRKTMPAEIILVGRAAVMASYGFRDLTTYVDAVIHAASSMNDAIAAVREKFGLPNRWLNADFMCTGSYSPKLREYSVYYKEYSNIVTIRTIAAEYLIAMKLRSGRIYKNDLSDVIGILAEHKERGSPVSYEQIDKAVHDLYEGWQHIPSGSSAFLEAALKNRNYTEILSSIISEEQHSKDLLIDFVHKYPGKANGANANSIIDMIKAKKRN